LNRAVPETVQEGRYEGPLNDLHGDVIEDKEEPRSEGNKKNKEGEQDLQDNAPDDHPNTDAAL